MRITNSSSRGWTLCSILKAASSKVAKMAAMVAFYRSERDAEQARKAAELKLLAEARIGEMSMTLKKASGGDHTSAEQKSAPPTFAPGKQETLASAGISKQEASTFERLAKMPKDELAKAAHDGKSVRRTAYDAPGRPFRLLPGPP